MLIQSGDRVLAAERRLEDLISGYGRVAAKNERPQAGLPWRK
uniref:Uncharacterized protein n=1 Tax=Ciceribacter selenitireducens ATCC BAA-1503 TaxID=1336235 RepID=A0A380TKN2_9HYPH|nr:unnamed protein product [Ciceribacter selenitireducens ATCC BAA-1503]